MSRILKNIMVALSFAVLVGSPAVAYARGDNSGSGSSSDTSHSQETETHTDTQTESEKQAHEQEQEIEKHKSEVEQHKSETEAEAKKKVTERAKEIETESHKGTETKKTDDERKKTCAERKVGLETKLKNLVKNADAHKTKIDTYFDAAVSYKNDNNLNDDATTAAVLKATDAKAKAAASVSALKALSPTINCDSSTVASDIATFKAAAEQARNDLKAYKDSVKSVFEAIEKVNDKSGAQ